MLNGNIVTNNNNTIINNTSTKNNDIHYNNHELKTNNDKTPKINKYPRYEIVFNFFNKDLILNDFNNFQNCNNNKNIVKSTSFNNNNYSQHNDAETSTRQITLNPYITINNNDNSGYNNQNSKNKTYKNICYGWLLQNLKDQLLKCVVLQSTESNCMFPYVHYLTFKPSCQSPKVLFQENTYTELHTFVKSEDDFVVTKPLSSDTSYIVSAFKCLGKHSTLEKNWTYWSGADFIWEHLPVNLSVNRITFHKNLSAIKHKNKSHEHKMYREVSCDREMNSHVSTESSPTTNQLPSFYNIKKHIPQASATFQKQHTFTSSQPSKPYLQKAFTIPTTTTQFPPIKLPPNIGGEFTYVLICELEGAEFNMNIAKQFVETIKQRQCGFTSFYLPVGSL